MHDSERGEQLMALRIEKFSVMITSYVFNCGVELIMN